MIARRKGHTLGVSMHAALEIVMLVLHVLLYALIGWVILSWLISFDVINRRNELVNAIWSTLDAVMEPLLRPIRSILPKTPGLDLSPMVVALAIIFLRMLIFDNFGPCAN